VLKTTMSDPWARVGEGGFLEVVGGPHFHVEESMDYLDDKQDTTVAMPNVKEVLRYLQVRAGRCVMELGMEAGAYEGSPEWANWTVRACFDDSCETQEDFRTFIRLMAQVESDD